jgi:peptidyl-prolyl cis-trans isomerase SurA
MKYTFSISALLFLAFTAAGAQVTSHKPTVLSQPAASSAAPQRPGDKPVARVNGAVLTTTDLVREEYTIFPYARQHNGIPKEFEKQIHDGALKMIIFEELAYQEALRRNMTVSSARMQRAEADFRKQFATPDEFRMLLQSDFNGSEQLLQEKIRRSLLIEALLKTEVENKSSITPVEVKAYYEKNPARFHHPETYTFQTISVLPPSKATAEQLNEGRKRIDTALRQAKAAKTSVEFGLLAEKLSDDDYRVVMGQHKPVPVGELAPQVVKALRAMHPGDVSDVIQIDQAYTIIHLQEHAPEGKTSFEKVKAQLGKELQQNRREQLRVALDQKLRQNAKVEEM